MRSDPAHRKIWLLSETLLVLVLLLINVRQSNPASMLASNYQEAEQATAPLDAVVEETLLAMESMATEDFASQARPQEGSTDQAFPIAAPPEDEQLSASTESSLVEPLRLDFPAPDLPEQTALRPALYPIPWALTPHDHFYFSHPIPADQFFWTVEDYRYGGNFFEEVVHSGMDIKVRAETPVLAAASGKVTWVGYGATGGIPNPDDPYGLAVVIRHDFGWKDQALYTLYAHLNRADVVKDQHLQAGQQIGLSGTTGKTTGPHLHFEVLVQDGRFLSTVNPELWLAPPQGWGVLAGRILNTWGTPAEGQLATVTSKESGERWSAYSYYEGATNSDPYYQENLAIGDLPAGIYEIKIDYLGRRHLLDFEIKPGRVNYFTFLGRNGFSLEPPPAPGADFRP